MSALRASSRVSTSTSSFVCRSCRERLTPANLRRSFTTSPVARAETETESLQEELSDTRSKDMRKPQPADATAALRDSLRTSPAPSRTTTTKSGPRPSEVIANFNSNKTNNSSTSDISSSLLNMDLLDPFDTNLSTTDFPQSHRLHIFTHKHNTHITLVQPSKAASQTTGSGISATTTKAAEQNKMIDVLLSVSTGNIGFRKSGRGTYDAAYQLMGFVLRQIQERGLMRDIRKVEVALRGFGPGREAVTKALLGAEGRHLRGKITAVFDATRLKQGGTRGKKPRRLG